MNDTLIVCPPSAPPPLAPPGFETWSTLIPFWFMLLVVLSFGISSVASVVMCFFFLKTLRKTRKRSQVDETLASLNASIQERERL